MELSKAFDPAPLITQLKAAGLADAEKLAADVLPIVFDWLNSSVALEVGPFGPVVVTVLSVLEEKAKEAIQAKI